MATDISERSIDLVGDGLCRVNEAAKFLGISRSMIYKLMEDGSLVYVRIGTGRRVPRQALRELAADNLVG